MLLQQASCHSSCRRWAKAAANTVKPNKDHQVIQVPQAQRAHLDPRDIPAGQGLQATQGTPGRSGPEGVKGESYLNLCRSLFIFWLLLSDWREKGA